MKRKILLLLAGLAVTFSAYFAYRAVSGTVEDTGPILPEPNAPGLPAAGGINQAGGTGFLYVRNDPETNRREFTLSGRQWEKREDDSFHFTDPNVQVFLAGGGRLQVLADEGVAHVQEVGTRFEPRRGRLTGNVRIFYYRRPSERTSDRPAANVVRIFTDDLSFDNEMLLLSTDGPITLWSREADLLGRGLTLRWNEGPGELDVLRIEKGQYMAVYGMPEGMNALGLGDAGDTDQAQSGETSSAATDTPGELAGPAPGETSSRPTTQPAGEQPERPAMNKYAATFNKDVRVIAPDGTATGIEALSLMFEWQADLDDDPPGRARSVGRRPHAGNPNATTQPTTAPVARSETAQPLSVYWSGPLEVIPTGYVKSPSSKRWAIHGKGPRIRLDSREYRAICRGFSYVSDANKQIGRLEGTKDDPVRLALSSGERASAPVVLFDRMPDDPNASKVFLVGAGRMSRPAEPNAAGPELLDLEAETLWARAAERIRWSKEVEAVFREGTGPGGRLALRQATFSGEVDFRRAADQTDIRCDWLRVKMGQIERADPNGGQGEIETYPSEIVARAREGGRGLTARQSGSRIDANEIELSFAAPQADAAEGSDAARARPAVVNARGNVRLVSSDANDAVTATCRTLSSNLLDGSATLHGKPARIARDANQLTGETIYLQRREVSDGPGYHERLEVRGAGTMTFRTDRDLEGNALSDARLVNVAWTQQMKFIGADDQATFTGEVKLRSQQEQMDCRTMVVKFDRVEPNAVARGGEASAADPNEAAVLEMGSDSFAKRRIREVMANRDVRLLSRREDANSRMVYRFALVTPKQLTFDANARTMQVSGEGKLSLEDYRRPRCRKREATREDAYLVSPSQTAFEWARSMSFSQDDLTVIMEGDVGVVHRSGKNVVLTKGLEVPFEMAKAPAGRETVLGCDWMTATFSRQADPNDSDGEKREGGEKGVFGLSGRLDRFTAKRGVTLRDGRARVEDCELLKYDRLGDLVLLDGSPGGKGGGNVYLRYRSRDGGIQQKSASRIIWRPGKNIARAVDVKGTGARPAEE